MKNELDVFLITITMIGGLSLFLYGLEMLTGGLKKIAGEKLKNLLEKLTTNRFSATAAGTLVTAIIQSSSVTTVLVVGFISAGLMNLTQATGIILGANIGTTITAQVIAFKITSYSYLIIGVGFLLFFLFKNVLIKDSGKLILGLGLIFLGMNVMSEATYPLRSSEDFIALMTHMKNPLLAVAAGALFTAVVQSSSATTGIVIILSNQGLLDLEGGIALVLGANIGTCATALLAVLGKPREAVQATMVHIVFNVVGVFIWLGFIENLAQMVESLTFYITGNQTDTARELANAHTIFNVVNTLIFLPFTTQLAFVVKKIIPDKKIPVERGKTRFIDDSVLHMPAMALGNTRHETIRFGKYIRRLYKEISTVLFSGTREDLSRIQALNKDISSLATEILTHLTQIGRNDMTRKETLEFQYMISAINSFENIAGIIDTNLIELANERIQRNLTVSDQTRKKMHNLLHKVSEQLDQVIEAFTNDNKDLANQIIKNKKDVYSEAETLKKHLIQRMLVKTPDRALLYSLENELVEYNKRVFYHCRRLAKKIYHHPENK